MGKWRYGMSESNNNSGGGIGLCSATFLVFLVLQLCGVIEWSWWWVTAPLWIPVGLAIVILVPLLIVLNWRD